MEIRYCCKTYSDGLICWPLFLIHIQYKCYMIGDLPFEEEKVLRLWDLLFECLSRLFLEVNYSSALHVRILIGRAKGCHFSGPI